MNAPRKRTYLSRYQGWGSRRKVYEVPGGLEIDEFDQYDIVRKRVFFDDVLYVTYHRYYGAGFLVLTGLFGALFLFIAFIVPARETEARMIFFVFAACGLLPFALRILFRVDCITIYGKRSKAQLHFSFRKARARKVFEDLVEKIRGTQERLAAEIATEQAQWETDSRPPAPPGPPSAEAPPGPLVTPPLAEPPPTLIPPTQSSL
jgi:hypothetical protein